MTPDTRKKIIETGKVLTVAVAKKLVNKSISICCKSADGIFDEFVDRVVIIEVAKVIGKPKQYVIIDIYGGFSYISMNGKEFISGGAKNNVVYFIENI